MKKYILFFVSSTCFITANLTAQTITKVAGIHTSKSGSSGDGGPALSAALTHPDGIAFDTLGNLYFSDVNVIRKIDHKGIITTVGGNGIEGYSGDNKLATLTNLKAPRKIVFDNRNNMYFSDQDGTCVRKISSETGIITTIIGDGIEHDNEKGYMSDNNNDDGVNRELSKQTSVYIENLSIDKFDNLYITEHSIVRKLDLKKNLIIRYAGTGEYRKNENVEGDGCLASKVSIGFPQKVGFDKYGNGYFTERNRGKGFLRKINNQGVISTIAGCLNCTDDDVIQTNRLALAAKSTILFPLDFEVDNSGNKYILSQNMGFNKPSSRVLFKIDNNGMIKQLIDFKKVDYLEGFQINCLTSDRNGNIYIGLSPITYGEEGGFIYKISLK